MDGVFTENDGDKACKHIFEAGKVFGDVTWEQAKEKGFARYTRIPNDLISVGNHDRYPEERFHRGLDQPRRQESALSDDDAAHPVLPRPSALSRVRRSAAATQGSADDRRRLPADADRRQNPLEHPRRLARQPADAAPAPQRAPCLYLDSRCRPARHQGNGSDPRAATMSANSRPGRQCRPPCGRGRP